MPSPLMLRSIRPTAALTAILVGLGLMGCSAVKDSDASSQGAYPVTVEDCGSTVTIDAEPKRILTVGTAAVEMLDAAGAADRITARTGEFGAPLPETLKNPPSDDLITNPSDPTTEEILAAEPDLVLGYGLFNADIDQLRQAGITVLTVQGECGHDSTSQSGSGVTLTTVTDDLRRLGTVLSTSFTADAAAASLDERIAQARQDKAGSTAAWVYYFSSQDPLSAYGGQGLANSSLQDAGLTNAYAASMDAYLTISVESLLSQQPDWIILSYGLYGESEEEARQKFLASPGVDSLTAVSQNHLVLLPASASAPSPSGIAGMEQLVEATRK
ncbi:ABC transporter substrate-binding protein [Actinomyces slackii]|uniref:Corrinoid ABC transporter substrate-binding protein n=1 Tax=Actinomyces slackii TaxID=52774 RepID=A0A3S4UPB4_9ACTO|nr:ABC transporter substrate-binding protein [Actinomyces slackii]VEG75152.1 corrinoid ABC transporter substrate-binding protein [Actinomyces slackii]